VTTTAAPTIERMTVEAFLDWCARAPEGRYELVNGRPVAMAPEAIRHARVKLAVVEALAAAIRRAGIACEAFTDGVGVRIGAHRVRQPDASVQCGPVDASSVVLDSPVIVVEVVSPASMRTDTSAKLREYFGVPSILHYLVVVPENGLVLHHARADGGALLTRIHRGGLVRLDPPGIEVDLDPVVAAGSPEDDEEGAP
jgi:Uma2 family endonuclease